MTDTNLFTPSQFRDKLLHARTALPPSSTALPPMTALIQESDRGDDYYQISLTSCESWIDIPHSLIENIEYIRDSRCGGHSHPLVTITYKSIENPELQALLAIFRHMTQVAFAQKLPVASERSLGNSSIPKVQTDTPTGRHWVWCYLLGPNQDDCIACINDCENLPDSAARLRCINKCCC